MTQWQQALIDEEKAVAERIDDLNDFLGTDNFYSMHEDEQDLIIQQVKELGDYRAVLLKRIRIFR